MVRKTLLAFVLSLIYCLQGKSQACTTLGQTPQTAFPICSDFIITQDQVPACSNNTIPVPCNDGTVYKDDNPYWYSFTCYRDGSFGFTITPNDQNDDYDWQLFDITGHNAGDVYTDSSLFVVGNWSGSPGQTGAIIINTNTISCSSDAADNVTTFTKMPDLIAGHHYLLLISHASGLPQSGYSMTVGGGTAVVVDLENPNLSAVNADCSGQKIAVKLTKKMKCSSLEPGGSDFRLSTSAANIIAAQGVGCSSGFDVDSVILTLDTPLPAGTYSVTTQTGIDGNTMLDNCDNPLPEDATLDFTVQPLQPALMDSLTPMACGPTELSLVFTKPVQCSSIAADGSDFVLSGSASISVSGAYADSCDNGLSTIVKVKLSAPITVIGNFTLTLQQGSDGNTLLDECGNETPASSLNFNTTATVSAAFTYNVVLGCASDTLYYAHDGNNGVNTWNWMFDADGTSNVKDSFFVFNSYGNKHISLLVSNGVCTDTSSVDIVLDNELTARFNALPGTETCPTDPITFIDSSSGNIETWFWIFGDGTVSAMQNPSPKYFPTPSSRDGGIYAVSLIVQNNVGCFDTARQNIKVYNNCYIAVPGAFTPNGDGLNDYLYPVNAVKADNIQFMVYNRWGQLMFTTRDKTKKWDGKYNGAPQPPGTYVWMLTYTDHDTGKFISQKGTAVLIR